jgi:hypothetical protein
MSKPRSVPRAAFGIAQAHGLTIVTRNTRRFLPFGVDVSSPGEVASQSV